MREALNRALRLAAALSLVFGISACAAVDASYAPRTDQVTRDVGDQRDRNILLNIVRASRYEPLNFTALAKYTANGTLQLNSNVLTRQFAAGAILPADSFGPNSAMGTVGNSFDLGSLENRDFYAGFLNTIDLNTINILLNSGFDRELVLQATIAAIDYRTRDGQRHRLYNDPGNNDLTREDKEQKSSRACPLKPDVIVGQSLLGLDPNSCIYQRFRSMLWFALRHGITTKNIAAKKASDHGGTKDDSTPGTIVKLCSDPSLLDPVHREGRVIHRAEPNCDTVKEDTPLKLAFPDSAGAEYAVPIFRSPYGVFQYLGSLLRMDAGDRALTVQDDYPRKLFPFTIGAGDCFIEAQGYCIPNEVEHGNGNGKQMIALLDALVALNTDPKALPITPSVQLTP